jgi:hypothetical protein
MAGDSTPVSVAVDETHCVDCQRVRLAGEQGWVVVRDSSAAPCATYCPDCMTKLVRDALGEELEGGAAD